MKELWSYLATSKKPIVMYGMGNGADKIIAVLEKYGRQVDDFFASDDFVRGQSFHGKKVLAFSQIKEKYEDFIILVSFGSPRREVLDRVYEMSGECELYLPDVPLAGESLFDLEFYEKNLEKIRRAREIFASERSKEIFDSIISYKLSGKIEYLRGAISSPQDDPRVLSRYKTVIDAGAYNGDTARETLEKCPDIKKIICFEPDVKNFKKLASFAESCDRIEAINSGAWDLDETVFFGSAGNRNSNAFSGGKEIAVDMRKIDSVCEGLSVDSIKYDVEGAEMKALIGSRKTIERCLPDLKVSLYHRSEDIFEIPLYLAENYPQYKFYLVRKECIPAWEIDLIATKR